jgi:hypothetical protein
VADATRYSPDSLAGLRIGRSPKLPWWRCAGSQPRDAGGVKLAARALATAVPSFLWDDVLASDFHETARADVAKPACLVQLLCGRARDHDSVPGGLAGVVVDRQGEPAHQGVSLSGEPRVATEPAGELYGLGFAGLAALGLRRRRSIVPAGCRRLSGRRWRRGGLSIIFGGFGCWRRFWGAEDGVKRDPAGAVDEEACALVVSTLLEDHAADVSVEVVARYAVDLDPSVSCCDASDGSAGVDLQLSLAISKREGFAVTMRDVPETACLSAECCTDCLSVEIAYLNVALRHKVRRLYEERRLLSRENRRSACQIVQDML